VKMELFFCFSLIVVLCKFIFAVGIFVERNYCFHSEDGERAQSDCLRDQFEDVRISS
jgi:hypothetical protein